MEPPDHLPGTIRVASVDEPPVPVGPWISVIPDEGGEGDWLLEWEGDDLVGAYYVPR